MNKNLDLITFLGMKNSTSYISPAEGAKAQKRPQSCDHSQLRAEIELFQHKNHVFLAKTKCWVTTEARESWVARF